jgi:hypothetical protein
MCYLPTEEHRREIAGYLRYGLRSDFGSAASAELRAVETGRMVPTLGSTSTLTDLSTL